MRGASNLENIDREGDVGRFLSRALAPFCPGWWLHPGQKGHGVFCLGWSHHPRQKNSFFFVPVGAYNRDKRPLSPRWPGLSLDSGQKTPIVPGPKTAGTNGLEQRPVL